MLVLDASALLALMNRELGWTSVAEAAAADDATISAVNYAEVLQKARRKGVAPESVEGLLDALGITVTPFGRLDARLAASFYRHGPNLSLADRVCLALAGACRAPLSRRIGSGWTGPSPSTCALSRSVLFDHH